MAQKKFSDLSKVTGLNKTDLLAIERADGTKQASFEQLCNAIAVQKIEELVEELPAIEENDTISKIVGKINKWQKDALKKIEESSSGGSSADILDSKEEIEANTEEGKVAGAQAVKQMFSEINGDLNGNIFMYENGQYFIQHGSDASTKKALGSATLPIAGLNYSGGYGAIVFSTERIRRMDKLIIHPEANVRYRIHNVLDGDSTTWTKATTIPIGNDFNLKAIAESTNNDYITIITSAALYGTAQPFEIYL